MEITTIDLGSNSLRVLKYDCHTHKTLGEFENTVGTADGLMQTGNISEEALERIINTLQTSIKKLDYEPQKAIAVTTQALRIAKNNQEVIGKIRQATNIQFNIIDGQKEAELTLLAIKHALQREKLSSDEFILLDIGGGSTELVLVSGDKKFTKSFPFGIVTLTQSQHQENDFATLTKEVHQFITTSKVNIATLPFVSTAGTPTTICAVKLGMDYETYDKEKVNGSKLYLNDINNIQEQFKKLSEDELLKKVGTGRTAYINTGIEIFKLFFHILNKDYSIIFDDGLREGVAIESCLSRQL